MNETELIKEQQASELRESLLRFTQFFFKYLTGRDFIISSPISRESHHITVCRVLTKIKRLEIIREVINLPPGSGKSTLASMFAAWCWAKYPDSNFLYISYSHELAVKHTAFIRSIVSCRHYKDLFNIEIDPDSRAKDSFKTRQGGSIKAFGSGGAITGQDAGVPGLNRFSGAIILDDAHKPDEAHSEAIRQGVINNYDETIRQRCRGINVPIIYIGQRVHEADLTEFLTSGRDVDDWHTTILKGLDAAGNALYPEMMPKEKLLALQEKSPYVFASQYQQDPLPAGGGLFKPEWFSILDKDPVFISTFITADTAETDKSWNDATVFSFFGIYEIESMGRKTGEMGLHWIDCLELRIEPKDLKEAFLDFYANCTRHAKPPLLAAIEKKSTGVTLVSVLREMRGMQIREIERTKASGSKTQRFLEIQPYIASKRISFTENARHVNLCVTHMAKITASGAHRHDDVCYVRGTKIATTIGNVNIEDITIHHKIITPFGIGTVKTCGSTGFHRTIRNIGLEGTPNHPIFYRNEFIPLINVKDMITIDKFSLKGLIRWKRLQLLYSMVMNSDLRLRQDILNVSKENIETSFFIALYMNFIQKQQFRNALSFTIKIIINFIIVLKIWNVYRLNNIVRFISKGKNRTKIVKGFYKGCGKILERLNPLQNFKQRIYLPKSTIVNLVPESVQDYGDIKEVFNLTVEPYGVYYANGILSSNCDTLADGIRIALIEKTIYSVDKPEEHQREIMAALSQSLNNKLRLGGVRYGGNL